MRVPGPWVFCLIAIVPLGCKRAPEQAPLPGSATPAPTAAPQARSEDQAEQMRHCPVTLPGVTTKLEDTTGGVSFVLTASAPEVVAEVRQRAREIAEFSAGRAAKDEHGGGRGGGFMRNCPILTKDTTITADDIDQGVRIAVAPRQPDKVAQLQAMSRERLDRAPIERAAVVREEEAPAGETRLLSAGIADLDGNGSYELVAGGFSAVANGRRSTVRVYEQTGDEWSPLTEGGWDDGGGSTLRNVQIADVDGDSRPEVVVLGKTGPSAHEAKARLAVLGLRDGKLEIRSEAEWQTGQYTHGYGLSLGDLDGDGKLEIVSGGFQFDGVREIGVVRVWTMTGGKLVLMTETTLDGQGSPSMRINDLAMADLDGDKRLEIVVAGRHGPLKGEDSKHLDRRRDVGDLSVLSFDGKLLTRARYSWVKGTSLRLRSVAVADLDGDGRRDIVAGGQYDADGKQCLALFSFDKEKLLLRDDASSTADGVTAEVKDIVIVGKAPDARVLVTGAIGEKPGRQGDLDAWRIERGKLVRDASVVSRNGEETRARAIVVTPDGTVLTIGHAKNREAMVGQVLRWKVAGIPDKLWPKL